MSRWIDTVLVAPLSRIYSLTFEALPAGLGLGPRIVLFGIVVNLALLPVYLEMERSSRKLREVRDRVASDVARMKRHFRGRERYFYIRAVHRQHGYHPLSALLGSGDLLIQVVVFATVYGFLSDHPALSGVSFGPIADLGGQDRLLGGVNLLPLIMTGFNLASVLVYAEQRIRRNQGLILAILFLVLLYGSPSGLVLYWTTNNVFSLVRNLAVRYFGRTVPGPWRIRIAQLVGQR